MNIKLKASLENSDNTLKIYDAELGSSNPSKYASDSFNTSREIEVNVGTLVRLNHKGRRSIRQTQGQSIQYSYDGDNWHDFYDGASGQISLTKFNYREKVPDSSGRETDADNLDIKGFIKPPKTMWVRVSTHYADDYKFQHVLKINVKNSFDKDIFTKFGSKSIKNPADMVNTEENISIKAGQTISFQGGYTAGKHILDVKYIIHGKEYHGYTIDRKNFSFGPMGHVRFIDKRYDSYRYSEILGKFTPPYFPPDGKLQLKVISKYSRKKVTHTLNIEVSLPEIKEIVILNDQSWKNIVLPNNAEYFYIPAKATGPNHMKVQWYYQLPHEKDWIKIVDSSPISSSNPVIHGLGFSGATQNTLLVSGTLNNPKNSKNGLKFRALFSDDFREISKATQTTTINFSNHMQYSINPIGYRVVNRQIDHTQELSISGMKQPHPAYITHRSDPNLGFIGNPHTILRNTRDIIGTDDRIKIKDPTRFPYRAIGSLEGTFKYQDAHGKFLMEKTHTTAWLVSKDTAVTVGRAIFRNEMNIFVEDIKFHALWENGSFKLEAEAEEVWLDKNFLTVNNPINDWAIIKLKKPIGKNKYIGEEVGWLGYESHPSIHAYDDQLLTTVYPEDKGIFWLSAGKVLKSIPNNLSTDLDAVVGTSGAPLLTKENSAIAIFEGVHDRILAAKVNDATRIIPKLFNIISHIKDK